jgi:membrane-associated phospholipid phosphatase
MYVGVHYLSDVLGGLATGLICAGILRLIGTI